MVELLSQFYLFTKNHKLFCWF